MATLSFLGDLFLSGSYHQLPAAAQRRLFDGLAGALRGSDLAFGNFEGVAMADEPAGLPPDKIRMSVPPAFLPALREAGVDTLSLSNNHVFDFGPEAFERSRQALRDAGFTVFGAGLTEAEAAACVVREAGGLRVGLLGCTCASTHPAALPDGSPGVLLRQRADLMARVAAARRTCDLLVVSVHWGDEHVGLPSPEQVRFARALADAGADVVAGHHAHVVQGVERHGRSVIAYGLGGATIGSLRQRVVWQGVAQDYRFDPLPRHRRGALLTVTSRGQGIEAMQVTVVRIGADGRPAAEAPGALPWTWRLMPVLWALPGYAILYRAVCAWQFRLMPRLRWLVDGSAWRRLLRGRVPLETHE